MILSGGKFMLEKLRVKIDEYFFNRRIDKLAKAIWKYAFKVSLDPKYTKDDAMEVAINIIWNDADGMKKILSYTDEFGNTVFPR
jgi:hypothetical protein